MAGSSDVLDYLKIRFDRVDVKLAKIESDVGELRTRIGRLERNGAELHVQAAEHSVRMDRPADDIDLIKQRLEFSHAPIP